MSESVSGQAGKSAERFREWLERRSKAIGVSYEKLMHKNVQEFVSDVVAHSPVYTGASSGLPGPFAYKVNFPSHPAFGMTIGNVLTNGGDSGWQIIRKKVNQYRTQYIVTNPMWEPYLRSVEYGYAHQVINPNIHPGGFVRAAWARHLVRRRQQKA